jgi:hypothetical protein
MAAFLYCCHGLEYWGHGLYIRLVPNHGEKGFIQAGIITGDLEGSLTGHGVDCSLEGMKNRFVGQLNRDEEGHAQGYSCEGEEGAGFLCHDVAQRDEFK